MNASIVFGILRHILTTAGGVLIAKGYTDTGGVEQIVGGICTALGVAWSIYHKKSNPSNV